jgi:hypothetical protein
MPKPPIKNMGASVRSRLLNLSKQRLQPFQLLLTHYVLERLLYRLSQTEHRDRFILKGAMLLTKWFEDPLRPTQDLDLLGIGSDDQNEMVSIFKEVCGVSSDDGVVFDPESIQSSALGKRLNMVAYALRRTRPLTRPKFGLSSTSPSGIQSSPAFKKWSSQYF